MSTLMAKTTFSSETVGRESQCFDPSSPFSSPSQKANLQPLLIAAC